MGICGIAIDGHGQEAGIVGAFQGYLFFCLLEFQRVSMEVFCIGTDVVPLHRDGKLVCLFIVRLLHDGAYAVGFSGKFAFVVICRDGIFVFVLAETVDAFAVVREFG